METRTSLSAQSLSQSLVLTAFGASLATGRWGSYFGINSLQIYFIDIMLVVGIFIGLLVRAEMKFRSSDRLLFFALAIFVAVQSTRNSELLIYTRLRDLAPFLYFLLIPLITRVLYSIPFSRILQTIRIATLIHLLWFVPSFLGLLKPIAVLSTFFGQPLFTSRYDHSALVLAIGGISWGIYAEAPPKYWLSCICLGLGVIQGSRAGALAALLASLFVIFHYSRKRLEISILLGSVFTILTFGLFIFQSSSPETITTLSRIGIFSGNENQVASSRYTSTARLEAGKTLINFYLIKDEILLGVGPGYEMVRESGAVRYLSGQNEIRAPHNWIISLVVRFGLVGTFLWFSIYIKAFARSRSFDQSCARVMAICILIVGTFGVFIESPFGSLPLAILLAWLIAKQSQDLSLKQHNAEPK